MPEWKVPLAEVEIGEGEIEAVAETYRSGWLSMGPRTEELERHFAEYTGTGHAIAVTNGTAALHLICVAAGLGPGDEVVVPSLTFVATVNAIRYTGATPVFAEIDAIERPWISARTAEAAIGDSTRALMNMTYGGHPADSAGLAELASNRDLVLLEDAAHGLGGSLDGRQLGTFGAAGAFSFFSNKNLPVGEGGMVVSDDEELATQVRLLRSHAMTALSWDRQRGHASGYDVVGLGFNYRIDEARATLATARLARLDADNVLRAEAAATYRRLLEPVSGVLPTEEATGGAHPANHIFTVVLDEGRDRDAIREAMAADGIQTSLHYPPVHLFSIYGGEPGSMPVSEDYAARAITLPLYPELSEAQCEQVVESLAGAIRAG